MFCCMTRQAFRLHDYLDSTLRGRKRWWNMVYRWTDPGANGTGQYRADTTHAQGGDMFISRISTSPDARGSEHQHRGEPCRATRSSGGRDRQGSLTVEAGGVSRCGPYPTAEKRRARHSGPRAGLRLPRLFPAQSALEAGKPLWRYYGTALKPGRSRNMKRCCHGRHLFNSSLLAGAS